VVVLCGCCVWCVGCCVIVGSVGCVFLEVMWCVFVWFDCVCWVLRLFWVDV
jgi:hypothetical protein